MSAPQIDLDTLASALGITTAQAAEHIASAIDAGLLRVIASEGRVALQAAFPDSEETR